MNEAAYDISHLLVLEAVVPAMPEYRSVKPVAFEAEPAGVAAAQEELARALLQMDGIHEEMIRRYLSMKDESVPDAVW